MNILKHTYEQESRSVVKDNEIYVETDTDSGDDTETKVFNLSVYNNTDEFESAIRKWIGELGEEFTGYVIVISQVHINIPEIFKTYINELELYDVWVRNR